MENILNKTHPFRSNTSHSMPDLPSSTPIVDAQILNPQAFGGLGENNGYGGGRGDSEKKAMPLISFFKWFNALDGRSKLIFLGILLLSTLCTMLVIQELFSSASGTRQTQSADEYYGAQSIETSHKSDGIFHRFFCQGVQRRSFCD
jgi:hypothetical protein